MTSHFRDDDLRGRRVTVMGLGRFGGGLGVTRWLVDRGARVLVTDVKGPEHFSRELDELRECGSEFRVTLRLGGHDERDFTQTDLVVANPAVPRPWDNRFLNAARRAGVAVTTEIALLASRLDPSRVIGVTGTVGKSTTTAMIAHALRAAGIDARIGGNIGGSLLLDLPDYSPQTWTVLELSSAMLHWLGELDNWSPHVSVVTSFSPNHLDWHATLDHYRESKARLFRHARENDLVVLAPALVEWCKHVPPGVRVIIPRSEDWTLPLRTPGAHNRSNASMALAACQGAMPHADTDMLARAIASFPGLPHRLELVCEVRGVRYYNDSKCTTPESLATALRAICSMPGVDASRVHLIAGGYDKGADLEDVARSARGLAHVYAIGATGPRIAREVGERASLCHTLAHAIADIKSRTRPGDVVLLSPACASWDQYANYEARGEEFRALARENS